MNGLKLSQFNYFVSRKNRTYVYNTLFDSFGCLEYDPRIVECTEEDLGIMVENGFYVKENCDEISLLRNDHNSNDKRKINSFVITPTTTCNARCFYCYEKDAQSYSVDSEIKRSIVSFILQNADRGKKLVLRWFGGEPLLCIDDINDIFSSLKDDFHIESKIVTNASLLHGEVIHKLVACNVRFVQISVDGCDDVYLKRKNYLDSQFRFSDLIENIRECLETEMHISLRLNFDKDNYDNIVELIDLVSSMFAGKNISMYPAQLFGSNCNCFSDEKIGSAYFSLIRKIDERNMLPVKYRSIKGLHIIPCMAYSDNSIVIDAKGYLYHCEHDVGNSELSVGNIYTGISDKRCSPNAIPLNSLFEGCKTCAFFPKCAGGCDATRRDGFLPCGFMKYLIEYHVNKLVDQDQKTLNKRHLIIRHGD
ncbi:4Fe-4S single cluster domain-containing protein [Lachnospiraceae bacterium XBB2008]|nr:4Fe-4S single cluster domain-containing protein [Lachnospiraceae bacterium XBB2008]